MDPAVEETVSVFWLAVSCAQTKRNARHREIGIVELGYSGDVLGRSKHNAEVIGVLNSPCTTPVLDVIRIAVGLGSDPSHGSQSLRIPRTD